MEGPQPPQTLAVLPTTDLSEHPEIVDTLYRALYRGFSEQSYDDVELDVIERRLAANAARLGVQPGELPIEARADPGLADLVVFSELEDVSRFYLFLYASTRIHLNLAVADTRTRRVVYRNRFTIVDRMGAPSITLLGLAESLVTTIFHLTPASLEQTMVQGARRIAGEVPPMHEELAVGRTLFVRSVRVDAPQPVARAGETIRIEVRATPGCTGEAALGSIARDLELREIAPGQYRAAYQVQPGDYAPYVVAEVVLNSPEEERIETVASEQPFAVDTLPPQRAFVARSRRGMDQPGVLLFFELMEPGEGERIEAPARYHVFRRQAAGDSGGFYAIGTSRTLEFNDPRAEMGIGYDYYIVTEDGAGNRSVPGPIAKIAATPEGRVGSRSSEASRNTGRTRG